MTVGYLGRARFETMLNNIHGQQHLPGVVDFTRLKLDFEDLPALEIKASLDIYARIVSDATYSIVVVGADDKTFLAAVLAVGNGDDVTRLRQRT